MARHYSSHTLIFAFLSVALLLTGAASQSYGQSTAQITAKGWKKVDVTGGCFYYRRHYVLLSGQDDRPTRWNVKTHWSGSCEPGRPINGYGTLTSTADFLDNKGDHKVSFSRHTGRMINGQREGEWIEDIWTASPGRTAEETDEALSASKGYRFKRSYSRGCETLASGTCPPLN